MHYRAAPGLAGAACARRTISPLGVNGWIQQVNFILFGLLLIDWYIISATVGMWRKDNRSTVFCCPR